MSEEKTALAHIDFLIDPLTRESLGITSRDLGTQVLRLCGGFNDLQEKLKANPWIPVTPEAILEIPMGMRLELIVPDSDGYRDVEIGQWLKKQNAFWYTSKGSIKVEDVTYYRILTLPELPK